MNKYKKIPIGIEFYKDMIDKDYYYVDKTLFIKELLDKGGQANLFTRPRRFGKTLTLTMLQAFFENEIGSDGKAVDNSHYFVGKKIVQAGDAYTSHMGKHPVIFLTLKSAKQPVYEEAYHALTDLIIMEYERHSYILQSDELSKIQKDKYQSIMSRKAERADFATALMFLSKCLYDYHKEKTVILLDEYDVPLENAYFHGFYEQMADFIRSLFESAIKTNQYLEFAVITGCLRISKESIFTGLNNLNVNSILSGNYAEYFGFVQSEVDELLNRYNLSERMAEAKEWYNGYRFGETEVYNPWSLINYLHGILYEKIPYPRPYWANTSSNAIIKEMIQNADDEVKKDIETLMEGKTIEKPVHEDITYGEIQKSQENLWNFLFFTGYLKAAALRFESPNLYLTLAIPNVEVAYIYENSIREWFQEKITESCRIERGGMEERIL